LLAGRSPPSRCRPALAIAAASLASFFSGRTTVFGGSLEAGAHRRGPTTLVVLGPLLHPAPRAAGRGASHIAIQSYMLALVAALGALYALIPRRPAGPRLSCRPELRMGGGQLFLALLSAAAGLVAGEHRLAHPGDREPGGQAAATR